MKLKKRKVLIGLTYGDPTGIGPEILKQIITSWNCKLEPIIVGDVKLFSDLKSQKKIKGLLFANVSGLEKRLFKPGKPSLKSGQHSYLCLKEIAKLAKNNFIKAIVTGPVSKKHVNLSGVEFYGQTDELARSFGISPSKVIMTFVSEDLRISLFTRHIPLNKVSEKLNKKSLYDYVILLNSELKKYFIKNRSPKIAILGLNPHAGENKTIGFEDDNVIKPVIKKLTSKGLSVFGPLSPDAILANAGRTYLSDKKQPYDVYVSMYHDQALPMFKAVCGLDGVNVTLGLPVLRVSVDHGTAFDIAGKNIASPESLRSAIELVEKIVV